MLTFKIVSYHINKLLFTMRVLKLKEVIQLVKNFLRFIKSHISLIIFIILAILFVCKISIDTYYSNENELKETNLSNINCIISEPMKTYDELLAENKSQEMQINDLIAKTNQLEYELTTYRENQSKNIDTNNMNPHSKSGLTVNQLDTMLIGTGLESQGQAFYDMENTYNVNALFAMGVVMHESANGYKKANTHNYFGFRGNNGWMSFNNPYDCIQYFGKLIHNNYSGRNTISAIQSKYCPDGSPWANRVTIHMNELKNKIA